MMSDNARAVAAKARTIYETELRAELEREHSGKFLSIEPLSGSYFLGDTFDEAVNAALDEYPDRVTHTLRIGEPAALHLGVMVP